MLCELFVFKEARSLPMSTTTPEEDLIARAKALAQRLGRCWDERLERLLRFSSHNPETFPTRRAKKRIGSAADIDDSYLEAYVGRYYREREGVVVLRPVSTKPDPAVDQVLKAFEKVPADELEDIGAAHRVSMQAENIVGKLLERYVATLLESNGWIWCCGETMRSVDFIKEKEDGEVALLQIKNRDNSENSSSSAIREGTTIKKWYRINSRTGKTFWELLPENSGSFEGKRCTEDGFYRFVMAEAERRPPTEEIPSE
jgi:hypothetical protein